MRQLAFASSALITAALVFFLCRAGRWPEAPGEWFGLVLGAAYMFALVFALGAIRAAAARR